MRARPKESGEAAARNREKLLRVMFQHRVRARPAGAAGGGEGSADGTGQKKGRSGRGRHLLRHQPQSDGGPEPAKIYGAKFDPTLHYGRALVTIPLTHVAGKSSCRALWRLQREPDPSKHFVLKSVTPLDKEAYATK